MATINYHFTCPYIDRGISELKGSIESVLSSVVDECCPLLEGDAKRQFLAGWEQSLYESLEDAFEGVRRTNESLREAAERQLEELENTIDERESFIKDLEQNIYDLEEQISQIENQTP